MHLVNNANPDLTALIINSVKSILASSSGDVWRCHLKIGSGDQFFGGAGLFGQCC